MMILYFFMTVILLLNVLIGKTLDSDRSVLVKKIESSEFIILTPLCSSVDQQGLQFGRQQLASRLDRQQTEIH